MASVRAIVAAGLLAIVPGGDAEAGAFTLERGETKLFLLGTASSGDAYFDAKGRRRSRGDYKKRELQLFTEYGVRNWLTLFGSASLQKISAEAGLRDIRKGPGRSEIGARARLWSEGGWIVSVQASGLMAGARGEASVAAIGETDDQVDVRGLVARSFELCGRPAFLDVAAGYRFRSGDPADEIRIDASVGVRLLDRLLVIGQSFNQIGTARWAGPYPLKQRIHKLQAAALFDLTENLQLVGAAFFSPTGRDSLDEAGATLGLGVKF